LLVLNYFVLYSVLKFINSLFCNKFVAFLDSPLYSYYCCFSFYY